MDDFLNLEDLKNNLNDLSNKESDSFVEKINSIIEITKEKVVKDLINVDKILKAPEVKTPTIQPPQQTQKPSPIENQKIEAITSGNSFQSFDFKSLSKNLKGLDEIFKSLSILKNNQQGDVIETTAMVLEKFEKTNVILNIAKFLEKFDEKTESGSSFVDFLNKKEFILNTKNREFAKKTINLSNNIKNLSDLLKIFTIFEVKTAEANKKELEKNQENSENNEKPPEIKITSHVADSIIKSLEPFGDGKSFTLINDFLTNIEKNNFLKFLQDSNFILNDKKLSKNVSIFIENLKSLTNIFKSFDGFIIKEESGKHNVIDGIKESLTPIIEKNALDDILIFFTKLDNDFVKFLNNESFILLNPKLSKNLLSISNNLKSFNTFLQSFSIFTTKKQEKTNNENSEQQTTTTVKNTGEILKESLKPLIEDGVLELLSDFLNKFENKNFKKIFLEKDYLLTDIKFLDSLNLLIENLKNINKLFISFDVFNIKSTTKTEDGQEISSVKNVSEILKSSLDGFISTNAFENIIIFLNYFENETLKKIFTSDSYILMQEVFGEKINLLSTNLKSFVKLLLTFESFNISKTNKLKDEQGNEIEVTTTTHLVDIVSLALQPFIEKDVFPHIVTFLNYFDNENLNKIFSTTTILLDDEFGEKADIISINLKSFVKILTAFESFVSEKIIKDDTGKEIKIKKHIVEIIEESLNPFLEKNIFPTIVEFFKQADNNDLKLLIFGDDFILTNDEFGEKATIIINNLKSFIGILTKFLEFSAIQKSGKTLIEEASKTLLMLRKSDLIDNMFKFLSKLNDKRLKKIIQDLLSNNDNLTKLEQVVNSFRNTITLFNELVEFFNKFANLSELVKVALKVRYGLIVLQKMKFGEIFKKLVDSFQIDIDDKDLETLNRSRSIIDALNNLFEKTEGIFIRAIKLRLGLLMIQKLNIPQALIDFHNSFYFKQENITIGKYIDVISIVSQIIEKLGDKILFKILKVKRNLQTILNLSIATDLKNLYYSFLIPEDEYDSTEAKMTNIINEVYDILTLLGDNLLKKIIISKINLGFLRESKISDEIINLLRSLRIEKDESQEYIQSSVVNNLIEILDYLSRNVYKKALKAKANINALILLKIPQEIKTFINEFKVEKSDETKFIEKGIVGDLISILRYFENNFLKKVLKLKINLTFIKALNIGKSLEEFLNTFKIENKEFDEFIMKLNKFIFEFEKLEKIFTIKKINTIKRGFDKFFDSIKSIILKFDEKTFIEFEKITQHVKTIAQDFETIKMKENKQNQPVAYGVLLLTNSIKYLISGAIILSTSSPFIVGATPVLKMLSYISSRIKILIDEIKQSEGGFKSIRSFAGTIFILSKSLYAISEIAAKIDFANTILLLKLSEFISRRLTHLAEISEKIQQATPAFKVLRSFSFTLFGFSKAIALASEEAKKIVLESLISVFIAIEVSILKLKIIAKNVEIIEKAKHGLSTLRSFSFTILIFAKNFALASMAALAIEPLGIIKVLGLIVLSVFVFSKILSKFTFGVKKASIALIAISVSIFLFALSIAASSKLAENLNYLSLFGLFGVILITAFLFKILNAMKVKISLGIVVLSLISLSLVVFSLSLFLSSAIASKINFKSLFTIAGAIVLFGIIYALLGIPKVAALVALGAGVLVLMSLSLILFGTSLAVLSKALKDFDEKIMNNLTQFLWKMFPIMLVYGVLSPAIILGGIAMSTIGAGLISIGEGVKKVKDVKFSEFDLKGFKTVAMGLATTFLQIGMISGGILGTLSSILGLPNISGNPIKRGIESLLEVKNALTSIGEGLVNYNRLTSGLDLRVEKDSDGRYIPAPGSLMERVMMTVAGLNSIFAQIGEGKSKSLLSTLFGADFGKTYTERGIESVLNSANALTSIAEGLYNFNSMTKDLDLRVEKDKQGRYIPASGSLMERVMMTVAGLNSVFAQVGEGKSGSLISLLFGADFGKTYTERGIESVLNTSKALNSIGQGLLSFYSTTKELDLRVEKDSDGRYIPAPGSLMEKILMTVAGLNSVFAQIGENKSGSLISLLFGADFGQTHTERGIESVLKANKALTSIAEGLRNFAEITKELDLSIDQNNEGKYIPKQGSIFEKILNTVSMVNIAFTAAASDSDPRTEKEKSKAGVDYVKNSGKILKEIADSLAKWKDLSNFNIDMNKITENIKSVLTVISESFSKIGQEDKGWFSSSPTEKGIEAVKGVGNVLNEIANGVKTFSELTKIGLKEDDFDINKKYSLAWNIKSILVLVSEIFAELGSDAKEFMVNDKKVVLISENVKKGIEAIGGAGNELKAIAESMKIFSEIKSFNLDVVKTTIEGLVSVISNKFAEVGSGKLFNISHLEEGVKAIKGVGSELKNIMDSFKSVVEIEKEKIDFNKIRETLISGIETSVLIFSAIGGDIDGQKKIFKEISTINIEAIKSSSEIIEIIKETGKKVNDIISVFNNINIQDFDKKQKIFVDILKTPTESISTISEKFIINKIAINDTLKIYPLIFDLIKNYITMNNNLTTALSQRVNNISTMKMFTDDFEYFLKMVARNVSNREHIDNFNKYINFIERFSNIQPQFNKFVKDFKDYVYEFKNLSEIINRTQGDTLELYNKFMKIKYDIITSDSSKLNHAIEKLIEFLKEFQITLDKMAVVQFGSGMDNTTEGGISNTTGDTSAAASKAEFYIKLITLIKNIETQIANLPTRMEEKTLKVKQIQENFRNS